MLAARRSILFTARRRGTDGRLTRIRSGAMRPVLKASRSSMVQLFGNVSAAGCRRDRRVYAAREYDRISGRVVYELPEDPSRIDSLHGPQPMVRGRCG